MRDYAEALDTLDEARAKDTEHKHLAEVEQLTVKCYNAISEQNANLKPEEALKRAQANPKIAGLLSDPVMQSILQQMQDDPRAAREHLKNPAVASNLRKLMAAGIVRMGILSVFNSSGSDPLELWHSVVGADAESTIELADNDDGAADCRVLRIVSPRLSTTYISCPRNPLDSLGIKLPFMIMSLKSMDRLFSFEVELADDKGIVRYIRASNFETEAVVDNQLTILPLRLESGWNHLTFDLAGTTRQLYGTAYREVTRVTVNASICLRYILFSDTILAEEAMPNEFRLCQKQGQ
ncbi:hypothetical protein FBU59_004354 [Linderina macrospora]|uniref:Uncharacterized protein n=1 Tax=Linderina macrospora TaxID=4868 RepID=A0ACC1J5N9_9FUNG|nr:hypothetical protein FBU59_004354 [Linderina macrospora]